MRLHLRQFRDWLKAKPAAEIVGERRSCLACPIANFYHEVSRGCEVVISTSSRTGEYVIDRGDGERRLPWWAHRFIFLVDGVADLKVSAARALEILAQVDPPASRPTRGAV